MGLKSQLDNRLRLCADYVRPGARVADIGTDHAYLPVWLCRNTISPSAIAADINPEPLSRGRLTIAAAGLQDRVEARLSDGLRGISEEEADDIVIAGMGGELIADIIDRCAFAKAPGKHFILQPMTKSEVLIARLCQNGFEIDGQDCCVSGGKCYTVLSVFYTGRVLPRGETYCYIGELRPRQNAVHLRFVRGHVERLRKQAKGEARFDRLADELEALL